VRVTVDRQIITADETTSERELSAYAERALAEGRYADAARAYALLFAALTEESRRPSTLFSLGRAYEGMGERPRARDAYRALAHQAPESPYARAALTRLIELHGYLEEWPELEGAGAQLLARSDLEVLDQVLGLGARALARVERGDTEAAARDVQRALDVIEELRIGEGGRLPTAIAQVRFAAAEVRRIRAERIALTPVDAAFGGRLEARCQGLLDAQSSFTQSMHAQDPHWAAMAGYRVGEMYKTLHEQVIVLPAPGPVRTEKDRQVFYAAMHLRYRILLEKALRMMNGTLELAAKVKDGSAWIGRTEAARDAVERALAEEKATLATFPFSEEEMQRAVKLLTDPAAADRSSKPGAGRARSAPSP
jgi:tetratricopeptide (TPR) repeat protein